MERSILLATLQLFSTPYSVMRLVAWLACGTLAVIVNRRQGIPARITLTISAICIPVSIEAARFLDVLEYLPHYDSVADLLDRNGSSIYGALLASVIVVRFYTRWQGIPTLRFLNGAAPSLALGESISRVGCFLAGCCYGVPWDGPLAVTYGPGSFAYHDQLERGLIVPGAMHTAPIHPVQLYSTILALGLCLYLLRVLRHRRHDGEVFYRFLIGYGCLRLLMAPLRVEALASMKVFSVLFIAAGAVGLALGLVRERQNVIQSPAGVR